MNSLFFSAGIISILVGLIHSVLGEMQIFHPLREGYLVPTKGRPVFRQRHLRIMWATWHLGSIFGFVFGAILINAAFLPELSDSTKFAINGTAIGMFASSILVAYATQGKHLGWVGLLAVALLIIVGR